MTVDLVPCCIHNPRLDHNGMPCWRCWCETRAKLAALEKQAADAQGELDGAVADIGVTILALRSCDEAGESVPSHLRARIRVMEDEWFNRPTQEGKRRRGFLDAEAARVRAEEALRQMREIVHYWRHGSDWQGEGSGQMPDRVALLRVEGALEGVKDDG